MWKVEFDGDYGHNELTPVKRVQYEAEYGECCVYHTKPGNRLFIMRTVQDARDIAHALNLLDAHINELANCICPHCEKIFSRKVTLIGDDIPKEQDNENNS